LNYSFHSKLAGPQKKPHLILLFAQRGPTTLVVIISSSFTCANCWIALLISTSGESRKAYGICIQLVTAIVFHCQKTHLHPLHELFLLLFIKFVPYMSNAFFLYTDPAMSSRGTKTRTRSNKWDMTAEHALCFLRDELKCSVDKSGQLDDSKVIVSYLNCSQNDVGRRRKTSKPICIFALAAHHT